MSIIMPESSAGAGFPDEHPLRLLERCGGCSGNFASESPAQSLPVRVAGLEVDFAMIEQHTPVVQYFARVLANQASELLSRVDTFCGVPHGGHALAYALASTCSRRYITAEGDPAGPRIPLRRHRVQSCENVALVQDTFEPYPMELVSREIRDRALITAFFCFYNRTEAKSWLGIPIVTVVQKMV